MRYLHTMVRVRNLDDALDFWVNKFGLVEVRRIDNEKGRYTLVFLAGSEDVSKRVKATLLFLSDSGAVDAPRVAG